MNKLTKVLSVFIIAGAVGAGVAGAAGCKKSHSHSIDSTKWTDNYDGTHDGLCSCGHLMVDDEEHVFDNGECIKCHASESGHVHSYQYTDNLDGTHNGVCVCGKESITGQAHNYVGGVCDKCGAVQGPVVESVTINGVTALEVDMTISLTATVTGSDGISQKVIWSVTNGTGEATITQEGVLTAVKAGTVTVKATSDADKSKSAEKTVTINAQTDYGRLMKRTDKLTVLDGTYTQGSKLTTLEDYATKGIYFRPQTGSSTAATDPARDYVEVINDGDVLALEQHGSDGKTTGLPNVYTEIVIGAVSGTVEGYFETKISALTKGDAADNGQNPIAFLSNGSAVLTVNAKGGALSYKVGGGDLTALDGVTLAADTYVKVYFAFDLANGKTTLKLNDVVVLDKVSTGITSIDCVELASSNKGARVQTTKNIVICGTPKSLEDCKADAKAAITAELAKYDAAEYTINGAELTAAATAAEAAVDGATDVAGVNKAVKDCKAALQAVLKDSDIAAAREKALSDLTAKYGADKFTLKDLTGDDAKYNNESLYTAKITEVTAALATKNAASEMKAVTDAADEYLSSITDTAMLSVKINDVKAALDAYAAAYKTENCGGDAAKEAAVDATVATQKGILDGSSGIVEANKKLEEAKEAITKALANVGRPLTAVIDEAKSEINGYKSAEIAAVGTDYSEYVTLIGAAKSAATDAETGTLKDVTEATRDQIDVIVAGIKAKVDCYLDNCAAHKAADEYKVAQAANVKNDTVKAEILELGFLETFKEVDSAEARTAATAAAKKQVDDVVSSLATYKVAVTVGENEICYVTYGTKLTLGDLRVSGFNVSVATLNGKAVPATASADEDLTVYNPVTVTVTDKTPIDGFKASEQWLYADLADGMNGIIADNNLFTATATLEKDSDGTALYQPTSGVTALGNPGKNVVSLGNIKQGENNKNNALTITVNCALSSLSVKLIVADSTGGTKRAGKLHIEVNGKEVKLVNDVIWGSNAGDKLTDLNMGDVVTIWAENTGSGGRFYVAEINAEADTAKIEKTVTVNWGAGSAAVTYHYFDGVVLPEPPVASDGSAFIGWYNGETKINEGDKFPSGTAIVATAKFATANVTVNYTVDGETKEAKFYVAEGEQGIIIKVPVKDGFSFVHWVETGTETVVDLSAVTAGTYNITAVFKVAFNSWALDYSGADKVSTTVTLSVGDELAEGLTVKAVATTKKHSGGYLTTKEGSSLTLVVEADATFKIAYNGTQTSRTFTIVDSEGNTVGSGNMSTSVQSFELSKGTYTINFAGGEHKITTMSLTYA